MDGPDRHPEVSPQAPVGVVIVSWNVAGPLADCLRSLRASTAPLRIVVVDNASADGTPAMVRRDFPEARLVESGANLGFTRANNLGMRALGLAVTDGSGVAVDRDGLPPDAVFLLNPDTEVAPDAVERLLAYLRAHPRTGLVGPSLVYGDGSPQVSARRFPSLWVGLVESTPIGWGLPDLPATRAFRLEGRPPGLAGPVDWIGGAAILGQRAALEAAGGFDEGFFMYAEELDLCRRLKELGWETHVEPAARVVHHEARSSAQVPGRRHLLFHRSRLRYYRKHHGRAAAELLRLGLLAQYAGALALEAAKWLVGHKRELRRSRVRAYAELLASGLS